MSKVSVNILTKNRAELLKKALASMEAQSFKDFEVVIVDDGSTDSTQEIVKSFSRLNIVSLRHIQSLGISKSRREALDRSAGEYVALLDDDDEWIDPDKLKKQVEFFDNHKDYVLVGGAIRAGEILKFRPESDAKIRSTMLFRNNFFTSTVMFRRKLAFQAGGFLKDGQDLAEDYDLWLRMGKLGKLYNFQQVFVNYRLSSYNKARFKDFLLKQLALIKREKCNYPGFWPASLILKLRLLI